MIETNPGQVIVREAGEGDWEAVMALIVELASYEKAQSEVTLTVEQLALDAKQGRFVCTLAECEGKAVGMALHHPRYSTWKGTTWYLEDLVVTQPWRGRGVGKALMQVVVKRALVEDAHRLEWQVLDWNKEAIGFYKALGASISSDWLNGRLTRENLLNTEA